MGIISRYYDDPRPLLLITISSGITTWWLAPRYLSILLLVIIILLFFPRSSRSNTALYIRKFFLPAVGFITFWCFIKFIMDWTTSTSINESFIETGILALRLSVIITLGLVLISHTTPRCIALSTAWYLRPLFKQHAWEIALALSLMLHTIPRLFYIIAQIRMTVKNRFASFSYFQRIQIVVSTTVRIVMLSTMHQTNALIARQLDNPTAWEFHHPPIMHHMFIAILITCCLIWLSIQ